MTTSHRNKPLREFRRQRTAIAVRRVIITAFALGCVLLTNGCNSREAADEAKMTSYSTGENKNDTADLFTIPQDQMAHVQVITVGKSIILI